MDWQRAVRRQDETDAPGQDPLAFLIVSDIRFLREGVADIIAREEWVSVSGTSGSVHEALLRLAVERPDFVLLDSNLEDGLEAVSQFHRILPCLKVVALAVDDTEHAIVAWAKAGAAGYIPRSAALSDIARTLEDIRNDRQPCPTSVSFHTLRRLASVEPEGCRAAVPLACASLTERELEISALIGVGLSNKEIARRLNIGVSTTKSHVHNLLAKLHVHRRSQVAFSNVSASHKRIRGPLSDLRS